MNKIFIPACSNEKIEIIPLIFVIYNVQSLLNFVARNNIKVKEALQLILKGTEKNH